MFQPVLAQRTLTSAQKECLRATIIDETHPGAILRDFQTMIDFVAETAPTLTGKLQLSLSSLAPLNALMTRPLQHGLTRPVQKSFPHINGLYWLLRASGLTSVDSAGRKPRLQIDNRVHESWLQLNPTERYCTLLEIWLLHAASGIIGEGNGLSHDHVFFSCGEFFMRIPADGLIVDRDMAQSLAYIPGYHNLALLELFGAIAVQDAPGISGAGWQVTSLRRTAFGDALFALLFPAVVGNQVDGPGLFFQTDRTTSDQLGLLQPALQPYFSAWRRNLELSAAESRDGLFVFKVALDKNLWRKIEIPAAASLEELSSAILDAYNFDYDHLYRFIAADRFGGQIEYNHPYMEEPPLADEVRIGDLPLAVGQSMIYNYDFGDDWKFVVTLERIDPPNPRRTKARVVEKLGKAPKQYSGW